MIPVTRGMTAHVYIPRLTRQTDTLITTLTRIKPIQLLNEVHVSRHVALVTTANRVVGLKSELQMFSRTGLGLVSRNYCRFFSQYYSTLTSPGVRLDKMVDKTLTTNHIVHYTVHRRRYFILHPEPWCARVESRRWFGVRGYTYNIISDSSCYFMLLLFILQLKFANVQKYTILQHKHPSL